MAAPHTASQLVQLGEPEPVGAVHDHRVRVRHIESRFDDHCRDENVDFAADESTHHGLEILLPHLPVRHREPRLGPERLYARRDRVDCLDPVVDEIHLPATVELARDRLLEQRIIPGLDECEHGRAVLGGCFEQREVAQTREGKVERPGDGRRGERQHVDAQLQRLQALFMAHAKAMLLIDDEQPEILERHVGREEPVRADDDVHLAIRDALHQRRHVLRAAEAGQHLDADGVVREALAKCASMLLGKNRRGHQDDGLFACLHRFEGRADRHFSLAVAHVSDQETVHGACTLHVALDLVRRAPLVRGVFIKEGGFELTLPRRVRRECVAGCQLSPRVQVEQFRRHRANCCPRLVALPLPRRRTQAM